MLLICLFSPSIAETIASIKLIKAKEEFKKYIDNSDYCVRGPIDCALFLLADLEGIHWTYNFGSFTLNWSGPNSSELGYRLFWD